MILFILEGRLEERIANTIEEVYFGGRTDDIVYCYENNIYQLYTRLCKEAEGFENIGGSVDILSILKEKNPDSPLKDIENASDIEETFLFFDYDFQHAIRLNKLNPGKTLEEYIEEGNKKIREMLEFFSEETEMGRLFIHYPMIESLFYTKRMPDGEYKDYMVTLEDCKNNKFKQLTDEFTDYKDRNKIVIATNSKVSNEEIKQNWELLKEQNVKKANYLCNGQVRYACRRGRHTAGQGI